MVLENKLTMNFRFGAAVAAPVVILAGAYAAWTYLGHGWRRRRDDKKKDDKNIAKKIKRVDTEGNKEKNVSKVSVSRGRVLSRSVSMGAIHGGRVALQRLLDFHTYRVDSTALKNPMAELETLLSEEQPNFGLIQSCVVKMEMVGKENEGIEMLRKALSKARNETKLHEAYEFEMLLVEMLIYKGDIEEASKCKCLDDRMISDARRPLYKAIIHILGRGSGEQARELFEEFEETQSNFQLPQSSDDAENHKAKPNFEEFTKLVESLRHDIEEAKTTYSGRRMTNQPSTK